MWLLMLANLRREMFALDISIEDIAKLIRKHRNSVTGKINGKTDFTIKEAFLIQQKFFPMQTLEYLFAKEKATN